MVELQERIVAKEVRSETFKSRIYLSMPSGWWGLRLVPEHVLVLAREGVARKVDLEEVAREVGMEEVAREVGREVSMEVGREKGK